jgi:hypothetical protein
MDNVHNIVDRILFKEKPFVDHEKRIRKNSFEMLGKHAVFQKTGYAISLPTCEMNWSFCYGED